MAGKKSLTLMTKAFNQAARVKIDSDQLKIRAAEDLAPVRDAYELTALLEDELRARIQDIKHNDLSSERMAQTVQAAKALKDLAQTLSALRAEARTTVAELKAEAEGDLTPPVSEPKGDDAVLPPSKNLSQPIAPIQDSLEDEDSDEK